MDLGANALHWQHYFMQCGLVFGAMCKMLSEFVVKRIGIANTEYRYTVISIPVYTGIPVFLPNFLLKNHTRTEPREKSNSILSWNVNGKMKSFVKIFIIAFYCYPFHLIA